MLNPAAQQTAAPMFQASRCTAPLGLAGPPSFARALRQRGLIAQIPMSGTWAGEGHHAVPEDEPQWLAVLSVFELHLRRQAMEQAFADLRGDAV